MNPEEVFLAWVKNGNGGRDRTWMRDAACKGSDPNLFFPTNGDDYRPAVEICKSCPVQEQCADYGLTEKLGIYGGMTGQQRERIRRKHEFQKKPWVRRQHGTLTGFHQHEDAHEPACQGCRLAYRAFHNPEQRAANDQEFDMLTLCPRCRAGQHGLCRFCVCECRKDNRLMEDDDGDEPVPTVA